MSLLPRTAFLIQLLCTLSMTGIIWFVQVVHYPLFRLVGSVDFAGYEAQHATRTGWVVGPLMCLEFATSALFLFARMRPAGVSAPSAWLGVVLVGLIWMSTVFLQVPLHNRLSVGFDPGTVDRLVTTNWIRTIAWTSRAFLVTFWTARMIRLTW